MHFHISFDKITAWLKIAHNKYILMFSLIIFTLLFFFSSILFWNFCVLNCNREQKLYYWQNCKRTPQLTDSRLQFVKMYRLYIRKYLWLFQSLFRFTFYSVIFSRVKIYIQYINDTWKYCEGKIKTKSIVKVACIQHYFLCVYIWLKE